MGNTIVPSIYTIPSCCCSNQVLDDYPYPTLSGMEPKGDREMSIISDPFASQRGSIIDLSITERGNDLSADDSERSSILLEHSVEVVLHLKSNQGSNQIINALCLFRVCQDPLEKLWVCITDSRNKVIMVEPLEHLNFYQSATDAITLLLNGFSGSNSDEMIIYTKFQSENTAKHVFHALEAFLSSINLNQNFPGNVSTGQEARLDTRIIH